MYRPINCHDCKKIRLGDILKYRIPGKEIIQKSGEFNSIDSLESVEGFIVSTFNKNQKYIFTESSNKITSEFSNSESIPYCVSKEEYLETGKYFLNYLQKNDIAKAILSRIKNVKLEVEIIDFFNRLCKKYPDAFVYLISSPLFGTWIGASPEVLITSNGQIAKTMALAGTIASNENNSWGEKEKTEQNLVNDFILDQLNLLKVSNLKFEKQKEVQAGPVKHLKSTFEFELTDNSPIKIAETLHPTPAVSGFPQKEALELITKSEKHDRKLYAGIIGWIGNQSTNLYVNLRCAEIINNNAFLYLGGGYTKDSNIEAEWEETESKAKTLLNVMINNR